MQNDSKQICPTGLDDSLGTMAERVPLKRKSEEDLESDNNKRRATGEAQATLGPYDKRENTTKGTGEELNKGREEKQMDERLEQERKVIISTY